MSGNFDKNSKSTTEVQAEAERLLERTMPQSLEMEKGVLGSILFDQNVLDDVIPILMEEDFYLEQHQIVYRHLVELYNSAKKLDSTILVESLRRTNDLERIGGIGYIVELVQSVMVSDHAATYAEVIRDKSRLRQLIHASSRIIQEAYDPAVEVNELVSRAEESIFAVHDAHSNDSISDIYNVLNEVWEKIDRLEEGGETGIMTGFSGLDSMTGGLHPSELIIVAARPSMGKTAFATNIADYVAIELQKGVLFVSLEMARAELVMRMLSGRAGVEGQRLRQQGGLTQQERRELQTTTSQMMSAPFHVDDSPTRTVSEIAAIARRLKRKGQLDLILIDYLQLIKEDNSRDARQEQVAKIARRLKGLAREMQVPVICLSQLNRQTETTGSDHRPKLSQLRESGAIEQDADVVMFVHREEYYFINKPEEIEKRGLKGMAEIIIAKQRNGPVGTVKLTWNSRLTQFRNPAMTFQNNGLPSN